jgi:uncharacterized protein YdaU (DUF1376 family)
VKKSLPYVPWYHGDFLRSTVGWTLLEQATYWKLLCAQWEIGPLPNDAARLASIVGIEQSELSNVWPLVSKKFCTTPGGLINERMEEHRTKYLEYTSQQSERGKKGMAARWGKKGNVIELRSPGGPGHD